MKEVVDQYILISICKWSLELQGIFNAPGNYCKMKTIIKIVPKVTVDYRAGVWWNAGISSYLPT